MIKINKAFIYVRYIFLIFHPIEYNSLPAVLATTLKTFSFLHHVRQSTHPPPLITITDNHQYFPFLFISSSTKQGCDIPRSARTLGLCKNLRRRRSLEDVQQAAV